MPAGLVIAAVPAREDPSDALVSRDGSSFAALPAGSAIGTSTRGGAHRFWRRGRISR